MHSKSTDPPASEGIVIALLNQKGGTAKSTSTANLGVGLARHGNRVLLVDLDAQASLTVSLGWREPDALPVTVATQMALVMAHKTFDPQEGILHHTEPGTPVVGVDLIPSGIELASLEVSMVNAMSRELILRSYLAELRGQYDVILLDCPPTLGMMTINSLAAADSVIIPVQPEDLSVIGMTQLFDTISRVKQQINPPLRVEGVLITMANMRTNLAKNTVDIVREGYGSNLRIYPQPIPYSTKVKEASAAGRSIFAYDPKGRAAHAYDQLAKGVIRDANQRGTTLRLAKENGQAR